jgi:beta-glucosidase
MVLGEHGLQSGEGRSRTELGLPGVQQELLEEIYKVNKNIVLILANGRPLTIPWAASNIPAILETWHLGTQSGNAIAQVVFGDYNPSGKLPMTFPRNVGQVPIYYNQKNTGRPVAEEKDNVFWSHYIDSENTPQYPFGFGLSYTTFEYKNLKLSKNKLSKNTEVIASVTLKNTGKMKGKEVVQWYIHDVVASVTRPYKELIGFEMVELNPGESKEVKFTIQTDLLAFYSANKIWETEKGLFKIKVGGSSETVFESEFHYE